MLGSEGCLGIITSVVVKVVPLPDVSEHASFLFRDFKVFLIYLPPVRSRRSWLIVTRAADCIIFFAYWLFSAIEAPQQEFAQCR